MRTRFKAIAVVLNRNHMSVSLLIAGSFGLFLLWSFPIAINLRIYVNSQTATDDDSVGGLMALAAFGIGHIFLLGRALFVFRLRAESYGDSDKVQS